MHVLNVVPVHLTQWRSSSQASKYSSFLPSFVRNLKLMRARGENETREDHGGETIITVVARPKEPFPFSCSCVLTLGGRGSEIYVNVCAIVRNNTSSPDRKPSLRYLQSYKICKV